MIIRMHDFVIVAIVIVAIAIIIIIIIIIIVMIIFRSLRNISKQHIRTGQHWQ